MPSAFTPSAQARKVAIMRVGNAGRAAALSYLASDKTMQAWKVGESLDFYSDLCKYSAKVAPLIGRLATSEVIPSKDRAALRSAIGSVQEQLRAATRNPKAELVADAENGPIMLDEHDDKPVTRYILKRTA